MNIIRNFWTFSTIFFLIGIGVVIGFKEYLLKANPEWLSANETSFVASAIVFIVVVWLLFWVIKYRRTGNWF